MGSEAEMKQNVYAFVSDSDKTKERECCPWGHASLHLYIILLMEIGKLFLSMFFTAVILTLSLCGSRDTGAMSYMKDDLLAFKSSSFQSSLEQRTMDPLLLLPLFILAPLSNMR